MDDVTRTDKLSAPREAYEPPRLEELGDLEGLTSVTDNLSVIDAGTTA